METHDSAVKNLLLTGLVLLFLAPAALLAQAPAAPEKAASTIAPANVDGFDPYKRQVEFERLKSQKRESSSSVGPAAQVPDNSMAPDFVPCLINVKDGQLSLAELKNRIDVKARFGSSDLNSVPATLGNIVEVLQELQPKINIIMSPGLESTVIQNFKLRATLGVDQVLEALVIAGGDQFAFYIQQTQVIPGNLTNSRNITPESTRYLMGRAKLPGFPMKEARREVEVFNLSGFIQQLSAKTPEEIHRSLDELQKIIKETVESLIPDGAPSPAIGIKFHSGANLLVVTGDSLTRDVAKKFVEALPSQEHTVSSGGIDPTTGIPLKPTKY